MTNPRILSSQDPADLMSDPFPFVDKVTGERKAHPGYLTTIYSPRAEYVLHLPHPTNRALVDMRHRSRAEVYSGKVPPEEFYTAIVKTINGSDEYAPHEKEHAARIAGRLATHLVGAL